MPDMADQFKTRTMKRKNVKGLALNAPQPRTVQSGADAQMPGSRRDDDDRAAGQLEIGVEFRLDLRAEDLIVLKELGHGNGGTVSKVQHSATKAIMARKIIHVEAKNEVRKRIVRELRIMHDCACPYIVSFYGAFQNDSGDVVMCMEYMDCGSLDSISKNFGPVRVDVLGKIAEAVLGGLTYLYKQHRIMHRDMKPSNILVNSRGQIKICDFGVSSELEGSVAETFVGTGTYMAPERIQGAKYTVKSDVWSVGLTLMELAIGKFPFNNSDNDDETGGPQGILDLLQQIVLEPAPKLPKSDAFPTILEDMIARCLMKDPEQRPTPQELYESDAFILAAKRTPVDLAAWAVSMMERQNRKSHLAPRPHSAKTREMLRSSPNHSPPSSASGNHHERNHGASSSGQTPRSATSQESSGMRNGDRFDRPSYPVRASSSSALSGGQSMQLPIRPAPPPTTPLPHPPRGI
ncbi:dual specificity mitogen-activated protein kinase [Phyllosticta capitalensis]|uniref:Dual specificity mitogen-activated protein kinase n=1 Tax=Phyllosticta capitalensis TaxID=121624 RepID=A0ABR1YMT8_9PEZI